MDLNEIHHCRFCNLGFTEKMHEKHSKPPKHRDCHLMNVVEAAEYLGISDRSIRRHVDNGDLEHRRVGWLIKFDKTALDAFAAPIGGRKNGGSKP